MKILLCTNAFEHITNGPAKFANLILQINERYPQHQIRILTEDVSPQKLQTSNYVYQVSLNFPGFLRMFGQILRMFIYYSRAKEIQKEYKYDLLVYINAFNGLWAAMVSDTPTVGMINDYNNIAASLATFRSEPRWLKKYLFKHLEKLSARYHTAIISNSHYLTRRIIESYHIHPSKVYMLYKAVEVSGIAYNPDREFGVPVRLLFVKADYLTGGLPTLARALAYLPSVSFVLTIIGPPKRFDSHVLSFFKDLGHVQVALLNEQTQQEVYHHLATHDIFCVPSLKEALGVANIEALASGIPVISTHVGGIPEVLDHGRNGWLVEPNNPEALSEALKECMDNPAQRLQKAENSRRYIEKFSTEHMFREFIRILEECK